MVDAIVSVVLEQLISMAVEESKEQMKLVTGVGKEVKKLTCNLRAIQAVLNDADQRQVKEEGVRLWLDQLKDASCDMEDVLDEWNTARQKRKIQGFNENSLVPQQKKVCCSFFPATSCFGFKRLVLSRGIALKIKQINETLDDIARQKDMFDFDVNVSKSTIVEKPDQRVQTTSVFDESEIFGREYEKNELISKLLREQSHEQNGLPIISLVGLGGIGKTTLAQLAYNNDEVVRNFDKRMWVCVSKPFDEFRIARAIIEAVTGSASNLIEFQSLILCVQECIAGKKFLLILDDMWNEEYNKWEPLYHCLKYSLKGSKILITTRNETVAKIMGSIDMISIKQLSENECWSMFKKLAFFDRSNEKRERLEKIGRKIVGKCKGLPLAIKTIGSLLRSKGTEQEWQNIFESEMWELEEIERGLLAPLLLSYNDLPSIIKRCFSYCAVFPKDYTINKEKLIQLWMAQGYFSQRPNKEMDIISEECFDIIATRSFFQEFVKDDDDEILSCKMHDIVHDFAQFLSKNECFTVEIDGREEPFIDSLGQNVRHSMVKLGKGAPFPISFCSVKRLRSLLIDDNGDDEFWLTEVLPQLFDELTCLRALDFAMFQMWSWNGFIKEIPKNIEKLVHLRYLKLSRLKIEKLPETLCELYNLQLLNVESCQDLKELPQGFGKLINLMYLLNRGTESLRYLPAGIERLTSLRRVEKFVVGRGVVGSKACGLESLRNLNLLRYCYIYGLGDACDVGEARSSELENKKNLIDLLLYFGHGNEERKRKKDEEVLEALQPPPNLKHLGIHQYRGNNVHPHWMMSLTDLRILTLSHCINCEHLPPLGKLPSLKQLYFYSMGSVKRVGDEFLGVESDHGRASSSVVAFPKLKTVQFWDMYVLKEWDYGVTIKGEIMPRLSSLSIARCPTLRALPDHLLQTTTLQKLEIWGCPNLQKQYRR